jgi:hypothetical protein
MQINVRTSNGYFEIAVYVYYATKGYEDSCNKGCGILRWDKCNVNLYTMGPVVYLCMNVYVAQYVSTVNCYRAVSSLRGNLTPCRNTTRIKHGLSIRDNDTFKSARLEMRERAIEIY